MASSTLYDFTDGTTEEYSHSTSETPNPEGYVHHFHILDYVVLVVMLCISLAIGVYYGCFGGKQKTTQEYFKGSQNMSLLPVVLSLMASFISSNGMLGVPAEVYSHGFNYFFSYIGSILAIPVSAYCFLPVFYDLQITSVYEYLHKRFDRRIRICGSLLSVINLVLYASFVTYGPALALSQVTGISLWGSILTTTVIGSFYTSIGGIKAVMWTDSMQLLVFLIALMIAIFKGASDVGGIGYVIEKAKEGRRIEPLSFSFDPRIRYTFWGFLISSTLNWVSGYGCSQIQVQRYLSCSTKRRAQRGLWLNFPGMVVVMMTYCFIGCVLYAKFWSCDPLSSQQIQEPDQIFPMFVMNTMGAWPGLPGLFVAGVYSASLSTISSVLNSLSAITLQDYIRPCYKDLTDEKATKISKFIAVGYGAICLLMVAGISQLGGIVQASRYLAGGTSGANLGLFTLGLLVPWANAKALLLATCGAVANISLSKIFFFRERYQLGEGSLIGMMCGLAVGWWFAFGNQIHRPITSRLPISTVGCDDLLGDWSPRPARPTLVPSDQILDIYKLSFLWIVPTSWFLTVFIGSTVSYFFGEKKPVDEKLFSPLLRYILKRIRNRSKQGQQTAASDKELPPAYNECSVEGLPIPESTETEMEPFNKYEKQSEDAEKVENGYTEATKHENGYVPVRQHSEDAV